MPQRVIRHLAFEINGRIFLAKQIQCFFFTFSFLVPFSKARSGFFYYNLLIYSQEIEECSPIFSPFSPLFLVGGRGEVVGKILLLLEQKLRSFIPFLKMKRLPETSFVAAVSTAMEGVHCLKPGEDS